MINQTKILNFREYSTSFDSEKRVDKALKEHKQTAFLSHSHKDRELADALQNFLQSQGWNVYIDWQDRTMPAQPNQVTASKIKDRIKQLDWFLYLATDNSSKSRWCPWEIGYADGVKLIDRIIIIPTKDSAGKNHGAEYLNLYRHIAPTDAGEFATFPAGSVRGGKLLKEMYRY